MNALACRLFFLFLLFSALPEIGRSEVLFTNLKTTHLKESNDLLKVLKDVPKFSEAIDINREISSDKTCGGTLEEVGKMVDGINGCTGYLMIEEMINKSLEAKKTRSEHIKEIGFKNKDSLVGLIKSHEYEKAYHFLQIYYDNNVLSERDSEGNTIFHWLAKQCQDPGGQEFLSMLYNPRQESQTIHPLKIKTSEKDNERISRKCSSLSADEVTEKFMPMDFILLKNKNGENVLDSLGGNCQRTLIFSQLSSSFDKHIQEFISKPDFSFEMLKSTFPDSYEDKIALILVTQPIDKVKHFLRNYDFKNFDFVKQFEDPLFQNAEGVEKDNSEFIRSKLTLSSIQRAREGTLDDSIVELLLSKGDFIVRDSNGETLLDAVRKNDNSKKYLKKLSSALNLHVIHAINEANASDPYLMEYMKNSDPKNGIGLSITFFKYLSENENKEFKNKIFDFYRVSLDSDDEFVNQIESFGKDKGT